MGTLTLEPLIDNKALSITCLEYWKNKLLIGTSNIGVVIYDISEKEGAKGKLQAQLDAVHKELTFGQPVQQMNVVEPWNCIITLTDGELAVFNYTFSDRCKFSFVYQSTLLHKNITKYTLCSGITPVLCLATQGHLYFYKSTGKSMYMTAKYDFNYSLISFVLTGPRLFVVYHEKGSKLYQSGCFDTLSGMFTNSIYSSHSFPPLLRSVGYNKVLFHQDWMSTIYEGTQPTHKISWNIVPQDISIISGNLCLGIQGRDIEIVPLDGKNSGEEVATVKEGLLCTTPNGLPCVASEQCVWHLSLPPSPSPSPSLSSSHLYASMSENKGAAFFRGIDIQAKVDNNRTSDTVRVQLKPKDSLTVLGLNTDQVEHLKNFGITNVKQFSELTAVSVKYSCGLEYWDAYAKAVFSMSIHGQYDVIDLTTPNSSLFAATPNNNNNNNSTSNSNSNSNNNAGEKKYDFSTNNVNDYLGSYNSSFGTNYEKDYNNSYNLQKSTINNGNNNENFGGLHNNNYPWLNNNRNKTNSTNIKMDKEDKKKTTR